MESQTPVLQQYKELKKSVPDALLFFRLGDFYELFWEDAVTASKILGITLTSRDRNKENPVPMAGVPHHSANSYFEKLVQSGFKLAVAEQCETVEEGKRVILGREIKRVFTPGIFFGENPLEHKALALLDQNEGNFTLATIVSSTGEMFTKESNSWEDIGSIIQNNVAHLLYIRRDWGEKISNLPSSILTEHLGGGLLNEDRARMVLERQFGVTVARNFFVSSSTRLVVATLIHFLTQSQRQDYLSHIKIPKVLDEKNEFKWGPNTARHLDLFPGIPNNGESLFEFINQTLTVIGSRQLRQWIQYPLLDCQEIRNRQAAAREIAKSPDLSVCLKNHLSSILDLDRLSGRIATGLATPRDLLAMGKGLESASKILPLLSRASAALLSGASQSLSAEFLRLENLPQKIIEKLVNDPPLSSKEGHIFRSGVSSELDELIDLSEKGEKLLLDLEAKERLATGISSLKIKYSRVFGYAFEVTQSHLSRVPKHFIRKQTLSNGERFFTEELKSLEENILTAESRRKSLEAVLFEDLRATLQACAAVIASISKVISEVDCLYALSRLCDRPGYLFPEIVDTGEELFIAEGRHPILDSRLSGAFVPNNVSLGGTHESTLLITGPNMGGKSTYMRQIALQVVLGQMGAPIPALEAKWGIVRGIFTRIGAEDAIASGQSTFMVEMNDVAQIIHHAGKGSLVILDEVGRGTSTFDGISVAWATLEWISANIQCRTLFSTHYHELTRLADHLPNIRNVHLAARGGRGTRLQLLFKVEPGPASESFGIQVAEMAGLPSPLIRRAWEILGKLERTEKARGILEKATTPDQLTLWH